MLTDSLLSSKKWDQSQLQADNDSETDSLEDMERKIWETGKFHKIPDSEVIDYYKNPEVEPFQMPKDKLNISFGKK